MGDWLVREIKTYLLPFCCILAADRLEDIEG